MQRLLFSLMAFSALAGCASNPNETWFEGAMMRYEVLEVRSRQYKLVATGAGLHKKEEVERGLLRNSTLAYHGAA